MSPKMYRTWILPLDPKTNGKMKVLSPKNMGEIIPKNEGNVGSHGRGYEIHPSGSPCFATIATVMTGASRTSRWRCL